MNAISKVRQVTDTPSMPMGRASESCPQNGCLRTAVDRAAMKAAIGADLDDWSLAGHSRDTLADALTAAGGRQVGAWMIDAWAAPTKDNMIPADLIDDWAEIIGSERLPRLLATMSMRRQMAIGQAVESGWQAEERLAALRREGVA